MMTVNNIIDNQTQELPTNELIDRAESLEAKTLTREYLARELSLTPEQEEFLATKLGSKLWRMNNLYTIMDKEGVKRILQLNPSQTKILTQFKHNRKIILKSRQQGISTLYLAYNLDDCLTKPGFQAGIQSYGLDEAEKLATRAQLMWEELDQDVKDLLGLKLIASNSKRMMFSNGSILKIGNFRGDTLQSLHVSELGKIAKKYPEKAKELKTGAFQAVGKNNKITIESTAEGKVGLFFEMWNKAYSKQKSNKPLNPLEFQSIFLSWMEDPDCTLDTPVEVPDRISSYLDNLERENNITLTQSQRWWYASKEEELGSDIKQEYPSTPEEAFEQSLEGTIFKKEYEAIYKAGRVGYFDHRPGLPVSVSYDIGVNDETVLVFAQVIDGIPRVINCYAGSGENLEHYVNVMWALQDSKGYKITDVILPHDAAVREFISGKSRYERFLELGAPARILKRVSVDDSIEATRTLLKTVQINVECDMLLLALQQYRWKYDRKLGVTLRIPEHDWTSNYMDSFKYMALGLMFKTSSTTTEYDYPDDYEEYDDYAGL